MSAPPKPIVAPGPTPHGPPGWEERQQGRLASGDLTAEKQSSNFHDDSILVDGHDTGKQTVAHHEHKGGMEGFKDKIHHLGEKMSLVPPTEEREHGTPMQVAAHRQVRRRRADQIETAFSSISLIGNSLLGCFHYARIRGWRSLLTH
jgi:hypothetical protein